MSRKDQYALSEARYGVVLAAGAVGVMLLSRPAIAWLLDHFAAAPTSSWRGYYGVSVSGGLMAALVSLGIYSVASLVATRHGWDWEWLLALGLGGLVLTVAVAFFAGQAGYFSFLAL